MPGRRTRRTTVASEEREAMMPPKQIDELDGEPSYPDGRTEIIQGDVEPGQERPWE